MDAQKPLKVSISVSLDTDVVEKLRPLAQEDDRTLSSYINLVLRKHLRDLEKT